MKRVFCVVFAVVFLIAACGQKEEVVKLSPESDAYNLGKELASKVPAIDPEVNKVLVTTSIGDVSVGEVLNVLMDNIGGNTAHLANMDSANLVSMFSQGADQIAEQKILLHEARSRKLQASDAEIDSIIDVTAQQRGGMEQFAAFLAQQNISMDFVREDIKKHMTIRKLFEKAFAEKITDDELKQEYSDTLATVRHILLLTEGKTPEEKETAHAEMQKILDRARAGEDFAELAREYTEDPGSKENGGLYENFGRGRMVKPFEDAAFNVPVGEISDIVETVYGYHILKIVDRVANTVSFEEERERLADHVINKKGNVLQREFLAEMREKYKVKFTEF